MSNDDVKILVSIFHKPGKDDDNFEKLKLLFKEFDMFIPEVEFYGNKWRETKKFFIGKGYDSVFVICTDVSIICGDVIKKIKEYANDISVGTYSFGTIHKCTFNWLRYSSLQLMKAVPFPEGYCFGANKGLFKYLEIETVYGYGIDVEMGYRANTNGLKCIVNSEVCIRHEYGKNYDLIEATKEYNEVLIKNPDMHRYFNHFFDS